MHRSPASPSRTGRLFDCTVCSPRRGVTRHSRDGIRPSFAVRFAFLHREGAGKAGWPLHPGRPRKRIARKRENHRYRRDQPGLPCAMVYGLYVCSQVNRRLPPSPRERLWSLARLGAAWARQDHTTSPSASVPLVNRHIGVYRNPLHVRDDAYAPLIEAGWRHHTANPNNGKQKYFWQVGLTGFAHRTRRANRRYPESV